MFASVAIDLALDRLFSYRVPVDFAEKLRIGQLLRVPFSGRKVRAFVLAVSDSPPAGVPESKFKNVEAIEDEVPFFSASLLKLVRWISDYTASPIETCLRTALPAAVINPTIRPKELIYVEVSEKWLKGEIDEASLTKRQLELAKDLERVGGGWLKSVTKEFSASPALLKNLVEKGAVTMAPRESRRDPLKGRRVLPSKPLPLNPMQERALATIREKNAKPVLLLGVTGSGKTEVYLQAIAGELEKGRGAIVLVPEISLTPQTVRRFSSRFGDKVAVLHSAMSDGERYDEWHRIRSGEAMVVVGPRSAVFAPVRNLGLIVVDEEHDGSYKQEETPRYNARDIACVRAKLEGARAVLGSATPSLESWLNVKRGKYVLAEMNERVAGRSLPQVQLVDMNEEMKETGHGSIFSRVLLDAIATRLNRGEQTILFLNRRGYSRILECQDCGWIASCKKCSGDDDSLPYTYHKADSCLRCHVCGSWEHVPTECPECHGRNFSYVGIGTQKAEDALKKCFPSARILRMDADSTSRKNSHDDLLSLFRDRKADILLGTQMIAKGLDFPNVTLVGVLNADTTLNLPDFRASERTYQLLSQVAGRAGRAEKPGEVLIQTRQPDAPAIRAAASNEGYAVFADAELKSRMDAPFPPYCRMALVVFRSKEERLAANWSELYAKSLRMYADKVNASMNGGELGLLVSEAVPCALKEVEGWYRYQITLRAGKASLMTGAFNWIRKARPVPDKVRVAIDVDALSFQ